MTAALMIMALMAGGGALDALDDPDVARALKALERDPPIAEVQKAALEFFGVTQDDLSSYRTAARWRALLPALSGTYTQDDTRATRLSTDQAQFGTPFDVDNPQITDTNSGLGRAYAASATWNLATLVFDPNQLETYALVGIHEDVVKEVTRLYYTRQHNILALALDPPRDVRARAALILRTKEIEAMLNAMTGGAWTRLKKK